MKKCNYFNKKASEFCFSMETKVIDVNQLTPDPTLIRVAADCILRGGLVAFPTETVYGLGANALNPQACENIYLAKGRPSDNPLIVHVATPMDIEKYAYLDSHGIVDRLAREYMPGPLTVVLKKKNIIPDSVTGGLDTVAIRCPAHPVARKLIETAGVPIAAPSANLSGSPSPTKARHVISDLSGRIDVILQGGDASIGVESTIISVDDDNVNLLRPGFVTVEELKEICGEIQIDKAVTQKLSPEEKPLAPGMKYRHYAPKANTVMVDGSDKNVIRFFSNALEEGAGVICFEEDAPLLPDAHRSRVHILGKREDRLSQARNLFDVLRAADQDGVCAIYTRQPPREGVGLAVYNRLIKACGFQLLSVDK